MKELVTMNQALATVEQLQMMTENEGVQLAATFMVSRDEIYKIAKQQGLEVDDVSKAFDADTRFCMWHPNGDDKTNLQISFFSYLN